MNVISYREEAPCILVGGPFDGKLESIACIGPGSPCDNKCFWHPDKDNTIMYYYATVLYKDKKPYWEVDDKGRFILTYGDSNERN
jgi:hypothetical protein